MLQHEWLDRERFSSKIEPSLRGNFRLEVNKSVKGRVLPKATIPGISMLYE